MLRRIKPDTRVEETDAAVKIADASFPVPFGHRLEFNAPVHGTWNIVHIGMLVPQCHQIYVCADNCMRGVVLTAAEMGADDRFSSVLLEEDDLYDQNLETITIEGVSDIIRRLSVRPRAVAVFLVCLHHFVGTDASYVYKTLEERFPDIDFIRGWMDPVMQKTGLTPEQKLKEAMYRPIRPLPVDPKLVCVLGDNQALYPDSDLARLVAKAGGRVLQLHDWRAHGRRIGVLSGEEGNTEDEHFAFCKNYDDFLGIGAAGLLITRSPSGVHGVTQLAKRLGRPFLYLPPVSGEEEIRRQIETLARTLEEISAGQVNANADGISSIQADAAAIIQEGTLAASRALQHARSLIGDTEITVDYIGNTRTLNLTKRLVQSGFHVTRVYLDAVLPEEEADFRWLQENCPDLLLTATIHPGMRVLHAAENTGKMLAIGPKAAWFGGTSHFVNLVEFGGLWGNAGIIRLAQLMEDSFLHEKDTRTIIPRKGQGCKCVLQ
ncbi:MAG: nitrogenase [Lachnospiraceae bacterium]|nr:nitrogenase [Lachnospiraceae bacterium]